MRCDPSTKHGCVKLASRLAMAMGTGMLDLTAGESSKLEKIRQLSRYVGRAHVVGRLLFGLGLSA